jgi:hypothetical protein
MLACSLVHTEKDAISLCSKFAAFRENKRKKARPCPRLVYTGGIVCNGQKLGKEGAPAMNLFWATRDTHNRKPVVHLTEFLAAALMLNRRFDTAFTRLVLGRFAKAQGWTLPRIAEVETQVACPDAPIKADMRVVLEDGHVILFLHSMDDLEAEGPRPDDQQRVEACLGLSADGVVHIRSSAATFKPALVENPRYIKPAHADAFRWRDIYHLLEGNDHIFITWLREGFGPLGLTPPHPVIGDLDDPDPEARDACRRRFAEWWDPTREAARAMGWKVGAGDIVDLYLSSGPTRLVTSVFVSPSRAGRFLLRIAPFLTKEDDVLARAERVAAESTVPVEVTKAMLWRQRGRIPVIDVLTSAGTVVGPETNDPAQAAQALRAFVSGYLAAL